MSSGPIPASTQHYLFVYGTLQSAFRRNRFAQRLLAENTLVGEARIRGRLYALKYYPCLRLPLLYENNQPVQPNCKDPRFSSLSGWVAGEVYRLHRPRRMLESLDAYEDVDYRRLIRPVVLKNGRIIRCWVYCFQKPLARRRRVGNGRWASNPAAPARYRAYIPHTSQLDPTILRGTE